MRLAYGGEEGRGKCAGLKGIGSVKYLFARGLARAEYLPLLCDEALLVAPFLAPETHHLLHYIYVCAWGRAEESSGVWILFLFILFKQLPEDENTSQAFAGWYPRCTIPHLPRLYHQGVRLPVLSPEDSHRSFALTTCSYLPRSSFALRATRTGLSTSCALPSPCCRTGTAGAFGDADGVLRDPASELTAVLSPWSR